MLVVSSYWPTTLNTISGIFVVQQVAALVRAGFCVTVIVPTTLWRNSEALCPPSDLGLDISRVRLIKLPVFRLPEKISSLPGAQWLNVKLCGGALSKCIASLSESTAFDAGIVHGLRYCGLGLPAWRRWVRGKVAIVVHGVDPFLSIDLNRQRAFRLIEAAGNATDFVVLVGRPLKSHAASIGLPQRKLHIVANGTNIPSVVFDGQRSRSERRRVVSVSNLTQIKGIDENLRALAEIASRWPSMQWEYFVVGDGVCRDELTALASDLGIEERVSFLGRLSYEETMHEIADADIFCLPSWREAFGIVYLEAMARVRPVIGCLENGAADLITQGENGLLIPPRATPHLVDALVLLLDRPDLCRKLGVNGRLTAEGYSWEENVKQMLELLQLEQRNGQ